MKIKAIINIIFTTLFIIITLTNTNYAITFVGGHLEESNGLYYYYTTYNGLYKAQPNRFKRINDTYYFVNDKGIVCEKEYPEYVTCDNPELKTIIGKPIIYDNVKDFSNAKDYSLIKYVEKGKNDVVISPKKGVIYRNDTSDPECANIFFLGDSFTYLLEFFTKKNIKFISRPGYTLNGIRNELLDIVDFKDIDYVVLFIGQNDLMCNIEGETFTAHLVDISQSIIENGATPVFISYFGIPNYLSLVSREEYDLRVKFVANSLNLGLYVDLLDIDQILGREEYDLVHPSKDFYDIAFKRIMEAISIDKRKN